MNTIEYGQAGSAGRGVLHTKVQREGQLASASGCRRRHLMRKPLAFLSALLGFAWSVFPAPPLLAAANDYRFEIVETTANVGDTTVTLRLVDANGDPVETAIIYAVRLDMAPDGMAAMTAPLRPVEELGDGQYRFHADLTMEGNWRLQIAAKIQGEPETVTAELPLKVMP
jgi:hypothetical protein